MFENIYEAVIRKWERRHEGPPQPFPPLTYMEKAFHCDLTPEEIALEKKQLQWGTLGKEGKGPLKVVRLVDCDTDHLENILIFMQHLTPLYAKVILALLKDRYMAQVTDAVMELYDEKAATKPAKKKSKLCWPRNWKYK